MNKIITLSLLAFTALALSAFAAAEDSKAKASVLKGKDKLSIPVGKLVDGAFVPYTEEERAERAAQLQSAKLNAQQDAAPPSGGFTITLVPGAEMKQRPEAIAAFQRAAAMWEARIKTPVTVTFAVDFAKLKQGVLGGAEPDIYQRAYADVRAALAQDAQTDDDAILAYLPSEAELLNATKPTGTTVNSTMRLTAANMKALGFATTGNDGSINFGSAFLPDFDFDSSDGVDAGKSDFQTIAAHEIGHALGFMSSIEFTDGVTFDGNIYPTPLDLFRFRNTAGGNPANAAQFKAYPRMLSNQGGDHIFDEVSTHPFFPELKMSTGRNFGDGQQASHWKDDLTKDRAPTGLPRIGLMDPTYNTGPGVTQGYGANDSDFRALDLIGWDIPSPVLVQTFADVFIDRVKTLQTSPFGTLIQGGDIGSSMYRANDAGGVDPSFFRGTIPHARTDLYPMMVLPDGKIMGTNFGQESAGSNSIRQFERLLRAEANGNPDPSFPPIEAGKFSPTGSIGNQGVLCTLRLPNGQILVGGNGIKRFNSDGTEDTGFINAPDASDSGQVYAMARQPDGRIVAAYSGSNNRDRTHVRRFMENGALDTSFPDVRPNDFVDDLVIQRDGKIIIAGRFTSVKVGSGTATARNAIARLHSTGALTGMLDTGFAPVLTHSPHYRTVYSPDYTDFTPLYDDHEVGIKVSVLRVALQADGKIILFGLFDRIGGAVRNNLGRLHPNGLLDTSFMAGVDRGAGAADSQPTNPLPDHRLPFTKWHDAGLALQADGNLLVGGEFKNVYYDMPQVQLTIPVTRPIVRLHNDPAIDSLNIIQSGGSARWIRGGTAPELLSVTCDNSTDGGTTWVSAGSVSRVQTTPEWDITGLNLHGVGLLRVRGLTHRGGMVEKTEPYGAKFTLVGPNGVLSGAGANVAFQATGGNVQTTMEFQIVNLGNVPLQFSAQLTGGAASDFSFDNLNTAPIPPGYLKQMIVRLSPITTLAGPRQTTLRILSDAGNQDVTLSAWGASQIVNPTVAVNNPTWAALGATIGGLARAKGVVISRTVVHPIPLIGGFGVRDVRVTSPTVGPFLLDVAGLTPNTAYTFRAYAIHDGGTSYTAPVSFTTPPLTPPTVISPTVGSISSATATLGGDVTYDGGAGIIERGVIFMPQGQNPDPFLATPGVKKATTTSGTGIFTVIATGLQPGTAYAFKAFARNSIGTSYASVGTFTTALSDPATPGVPDYTFGSGGQVRFLNVGLDGLNAVALQEDGCIVATGYTWNAVTGTNVATLRYKPDGTLDPAFGGVRILGGYDYDEGRAVVVQPDGRIVVASNTSTYRYLTNGSLDPDFAGAYVGLDVYGMALQSDGKILVAGGGAGAFGIVRYHGNGQLDTDFGINGRATATMPGAANNFAKGIVVQPDGKIVVAVEVGYKFGVARFTDTGVLDTSFDTDGMAMTNIGGTDCVTTSLALQSDGKIVVAGHSDGVALARFTDSGALDPGFGTNGTLRTQFSSGRGNSVVVQQDGKIVVAGYAPNFGGVPVSNDFLGVRYLPNGTLDPSFGTGGIIFTDFGNSHDYGNAMALQKDGKIVVVGRHHDPIYGHDSFSLVRWWGNPVRPIVTTPTKANIIGNNATLGGTVITDGGLPLIERGVVYAPTAENPDPLVEGTHTPATSTVTGPLATSVTGLRPRTQYTFKAYAINGVGAGYSPPDTFTTGNSAPEALATSAVGTTGDQQTITIDFPTTDADGDVVTITGTSLAVGLTVDSFTDNTVTFTPHANFTGNGSFKYTVSDGFGGTGTATITVAVTDNDAPTGLAHADVGPIEATSAEGAVVTYAAATANDNMGTPTLTYSQDSGTIFPMGVTTVTVTAKDAAGNEATGSFTVTVRDSTAPVIAAHANVGPLVATSAAGRVVIYAPAIVTDAVTSSPVITYSQNSGTTFPIGTTLVTITARDAANHVSTSSFNVTVTGFNSAPVVTVDPTAALDLASTGSLETARYHHTATKLSDGKVLVAGGFNDTGALMSAEIYDPALGTWSTAASMGTARRLATAALLPDGRVLVVGGQSGGYDSLAGAEIYDPFANTWKAAGSLGTARDSHVSTVLQNGKVLVVGGYGVAGYLASAEIYDPGTDTWSAAGNIGEGRVSHAAALMGSGKVLVTGGYGSDIFDDAWTYDPATNSWTAAAPLFEARIDHTMTVLANGKVLVAGGVTPATAFSDTAGVYDPVANAWTPTGALITGRSSHSAIALADGRVLIAGGTGYSGTLDSAEAYDAGTDTWSAAGTFDTGRFSHTMTLLNNGLMLAVGGIHPAHGCLASAENGGAEAFTTEGVPVTQTGTFSDAEGSGTVTLTASSGTLTKDVSAGTWSWTRTDADGRVSPAVNITATDSAGTVTVASFTYMVANVAPVAALSGPAIANEDTAVTFDFTATDVAAADQSAGFAWKLHFGDATDYVNLPAGTASPLSQAHTFAQPGTFTVKATATDKDGGVSAQVTQSITILDVTPPDTTITSAPSGAVASTTAEIVFEASDNVEVTGIEGKLDDGPYGPVTSPVTLTGLSEGQHTFSVRATDSVGLVDLTPATVTWVVDTVAPDTTITSTQPTATNSTSATITFTGADATAVASFEGRLDGAAFATVTSPVTLSGLSNGSHTYEVRSIDSAGNVDATPASVAWLLDTVAPTLTLPSPITIAATSPAGAVVTYSASASDSSSGVATSSFTPASGSTFALGMTTVNASATDNAGNTATGSFTVTVTNTAPVVAVAGVGALVRTTLVNFTGQVGANPGSYPQGSLMQGSDGNFYGMTLGGGTGGLGTVFQMTAAGVRTTLVNFTGGGGANPGAYPYGSLVQGSDGNFYGMTNKGGTVDLGTVFKMTVSGVLTTLVNFDSSNGASPQGSLVQGSDGNFYGMTQQGGTSGAGTVFQMTAVGVRTTLVNFTGSGGANPGLYPQGSLVQGSDGNFYGMTQQGGTSGAGTVFQMTAVGVRTTLVNFTGSGGVNPGAYPHGSLVQGSDGNFYGMTQQGGTGGLGTVFQITAAGVRTTLENFTGSVGANPGAYPSGGLVQGSDGNFYGMTNQGGPADLGTVFQMTAAGVRTTLVNFTGSVGANPGAYPHGCLVQGSDGNFYGMTPNGGTGGAGTVFKLASSAVVVTAAEGSPATQAGTFSDADGNATVTLTASSGAITQNNAAGTWGWSATGADGPATSTVTITATDSAGATTAVPFTFTVTNVAPAFDLGSNDSLPVGSGELSRSVGFTDPGTDVWSGTVDYGDGSGAAALSVNQGAKTFALSHTYTTTGTFTVSVTLNDDDGGTATDTYTVTTLLNRTPTITSHGGGASTSINVAENTTAVTTVTATDPEVPATQSLTYSKSGPDAALFNIGSSSGVLTFATAPDFEGTHGDTYYVTVIATDNGTPSLFDSQALTITVTDVTDPISSPGGDVVSGGGAPDATGGDSGADFDVIKRGGFLSQNGTLVFPGNLLVGFGTPPVTLNDFQGLWKENGTGLKLIARTGTIAPGTSTATFNGLPNVPAISDNGDVTILGALTVGVGGTTVNDDTGLWTQVGSGTTPSTFKLLAREGFVIPGTSAVVRKFASGAYATASLSSTQGVVAYSVTTVGAPDKTAIYSTTMDNGVPTSSSALAIEGNAAPGVPGLTFGPLASSYSDPARMDAAGNVAFAALLKPSNKESLWYAPFSTGVATKIFVAGDVAPDTGGATFLNLKSQAMGATGIVTFRGVLTNNTGDNTGNLKNDGIWRGTGSNAASYTCILRRGDSNATRPGLNLPSAADKVGNLWHSWFTNANHGAWLGQFDAGGDGTSVPAPGDRYAIYTDLSGTMTLYMLYGDPAPGIPGAVMDTLDLPIVGGQEQMVFIGKVTGGGVTAGVNDQGIWRSAPNGGALSLLVRTGDTMTTTAGTKTIAKVDFPGSGSKTRQWEQPVMDSTGRVMIFVTFIDGSTSQIIAP